MADNRVLVLVGSLRSGSVNRQLAETAAAVAPDGVDVQIFDGLADVPFYNEDIDNPQAPIETAQSLRDAAADADALLLVTPEYNGTIPAVLKNAIDWLSRPYGQGALRGKNVAIISASPSRNAAQWAHADTAKSVGIAGGTVLEDVALSVGGTGERFGSRHPKENQEFADEVATLVRDLVSAPRTELLSA